MPPLLPTAVLFACAVMAGPGAQQGPRVNPRAAALKEFGDRTRSYVELRERVNNQLPDPGAGASVEEVQRHQAELARGIREARKTARRGDIFTDPVVPQFRTIIRRDLQSRELRDAMAAMQEVPSVLSVRVNDIYPEEAPRATVPPRLLANLYQLPEALEYRFMGRHLVLVDREANLVVDFIPNVVPSVVRRR